MSIPEYSQSKQKPKFAIAIQRLPDEFERITSPAAGYKVLLDYKGLTDNHVILKFGTDYSEVVWRWSTEMSRWVPESHASDTEVQDGC